MNGLTKFVREVTDKARGEGIDLAAEMGVSKAIIRMWRNGAVPKVDNLYALCEAAGCDDRKAEAHFHWSAIHAPDVGGAK